jgi:hypothetical protein
MAAAAAMPHVIAAVAAVAVVATIVITIIVAAAAMVAAVAVAKAPVLLLLLRAVVLLLRLPRLPRAARALLRPVQALLRLLPARLPPVRLLRQRRPRRRPRRRSSLLTNSEAPPACWRRLDCFDARQSQTADGWKTALSLHLMKRLEAGSLLRSGFFCARGADRICAIFLAGWTGTERTAQALQWHVIEPKIISQIKARHIFSLLAIQSNL